MGWKSWFRARPYWLGGGIYGLLIFIILEIIALFFTYGTGIPWEFFAPVGVLNMIVGLPLHLITEPLLVGRGPSNVHLDDVFGFWINPFIMAFIIGAVLGLIVGKVKSRRHRRRMRVPMPPR